MLPTVPLKWWISGDVKNAHWQSKLIGLSFTIMTSRSAFWPSQLLAEKLKFFNSTWSAIMCSRIRTPRPKLLILLSFFLGEDTRSTDTSFYIPQLPEVCRSVIFGPPCIIEFLKFLVFWSVKFVIKKAISWVLYEHKDMYRQIWALPTNYWKESCFRCKNVKISARSRKLPCKNIV